MSLEANLNPQGPQGDITSALVAKFTEGRREGQIITVFNEDGSRTERHLDKKGHLFRENIYKDVNGDGKEDLYSVTNFYQTGGKQESKTYIDNDGDGYDDETLTREYENGKVKREIRYIEEDIKDVKRRNHLEYEVHNRRMDVHNGGLFMMDAAYIKGMDK